MIASGERCDTVVLEVYMCAETNASSSGKPEDASSRQPLETAQQAAYAETIEREAQGLESRDFKAAWAQSLKSPIDIVSERFSSLELCGLSLIHI